MTLAGPALSRRVCPHLAQGVVLNLRVDTDETRALGVENHVCEVQLLPKSSAYMQVGCRRRL